MSMVHDTDIKMASNRTIGRRQTPAVTKLLLRKIIDSISSGKYGFASVSKRRKGWLLAFGSWASQTLLKFLHPHVINV